MAQNISCTCCDQLWYRSSVTKCDANNWKYSKCTKNLLDVCITGKTSVENIESGMSLPLKKVMQERLVCYDFYMRKLVMTQLKYML